MTEGIGLPRGWLRTTVAEVGRVQLGRQRSPKNHTGTHMRPYLRVANVFENRIDLDDVMEMNFTPVEYEVYRLHDGDILLNEGQSLELVGRPAMYRNDLPGSCFTNSLVRFQAGEGLNPRFALYVFLGYLHTGRFRKIASITVNIAHLGAGRFGSLEFWLPPLPEQHRIVEKIDELFSNLDSGVKALERARANLKRYRASVLKAAVEGRLTEDWRKDHPQSEDGQMLLDRILRERRLNWEQGQLKKFGEKGKEPPNNWQSKYEEPSAPDTSELPELPEGWAWATVGQLLHGIEGGTSFQCLTRMATAEEWGVIKVSAMTWGTFLEEEQKALPPDTEFDPDAEIRSGDLLLSRCNTVDLVGASVLVSDCRPRLLLSDKSLRLLASTCINKQWLHKVLSSRMVRQQMSDVATGSSNSMRNVSQEKINAVCVPLPPLAEHEQIVALVEERITQIDAAEKTIDAELIRSKRLRQSILKRAFEGTLVPQDPQDEPAGVLVERIKVSRYTALPKKSKKAIEAEPK